MGELCCGAHGRGGPGAEAPGGWGGGEDPTVPAASSKKDKADSPEALLRQADPFFLPIIVTHLEASMVGIKAR